MTLACPHCGHTKSNVCTTENNKPDTISRVRSCLACGQPFTTYERLPVAVDTVLSRGGHGSQAVDGAHQTIKFISEKANSHHLPFREIGKLAGIHARTLSRWVRGNAAPNIYDVEAVLNVLGYRLEVTRNEDEESHHGFDGSSSGGSDCSASTQGSPHPDQ